MAPRRRSVNALGTDQPAANRRVPPVPIPPLVAPTTTPAVGIIPPTAPSVALVVLEAPGVVPAAPAAQVLQSLLGLLNNHVTPQPAVPPTLSLDRVDPTEAEAWVLEMEKIFDVLGCSADQKVAFVAFRFKGQAEHWWRIVKRQYEGREIELVWSKFLELFNEKYFSETVQRQKQVDFLNLKQNDMTVAQYEAKFVELSRYAPHQVAIEEDRVMLFENGLRSEIYAKVAILEMKRYSTLVSKALLVEKGAEEENKVEEQKAKEPQNKRLREEGQVEHRGGGCNPSKKYYTQG
ncbi:uncharacterized protein LOC114266587 [Camellia sinensis]|uniref:uncharacterized protein LOC114266587 n=1 Tax=Camellia sinensis TaxID=4442 RepID=UPI001036C9C5|nr:uncharacterized protein LOC114266587 [Camellia sinensis]